MDRPRALDAFNYLECFKKMIKSDIGNEIFNGLADRKMNRAFCGFWHLSTIRHGSQYIDEFFYEMFYIKK